MRAYLRDQVTGAAWLSSARVVRCWVKSHNERNPRRQLDLSGETAAQNAEEGGDDVLANTPNTPNISRHELTTAMQHLSPVQLT